VRQTIKNNTYPVFYKSLHNDTREYMKNIIFFIALLFPICNNAQIISTIVGNGSHNNTGDNGPATAASIAWPDACVFDANGNLYFSTVGDSKIRKISPSGIITTVAGTSMSGYNGDEIAATTAKLSDVGGIAIDKNNNVFIADGENNRVRKIDITSGIITTVAGTGAAGYGGDNGPATDAILKGVENICFDKSGNLYVLDYGNYRIRKINTSGIISTIAGNGTAGDDGDDGLATNATVEDMTGICTDNEGNIYFSEMGMRIRKINATTGIITHVGGIKNEGDYATGDGGPATAAAIDPFYIAFDRLGNLYVSGYIYNDIRMIDKSGIIHTIAGTGINGFSGDNGLATKAKLSSPNGVAFDSCDNLYFSDKGNIRIRKITFNPFCWELDSKNIAQNTNINIYPNPTYNLLNIDNLKTNSTYRLISMVGATMQQGTLNKGSNNISLQAIPTGLYLLEIIDEEGKRSISKVVKE